MNAVGNNIKKFRKRENMTQQALAERLNVTRQAVSQWENGNTQPDLDTLAVIAGVFGVDMMEVIYGDKKASSSDCAIRPRKKYIVWCVMFALLALTVLFVLTVFYPKDPFINNLNGFSISPNAIIYEDLEFYLEPLLYLFISIAVLNGVSLIWDVRIGHKSIKIGVLIVALAFLLFYYAMGIIYHGGNLPEAIYHFEVFVDNNPAFFLVPGIGLFLGLNGLKTEHNTAKQYP